MKPEEILKLYENREERWYDLESIAFESQMMVDGFNFQTPRKLNLKN